MKKAADNPPANQSSVVNVEDRDPNRLNRHVQVIWPDVIGEPNDNRSPDCVWRLSNKCFRVSKNCCYVLLSVFIAPLAALCLGFVFACLAFENVWCIFPCLRAWRIMCSAYRNFWTISVQSIIMPVMEAFGYFFYNIRVLNQKLPDGPSSRNDVFIV